MTVIAKATRVVHMITRTGERAVLPDGTVSSDRSPEALLCGEEIVGATFNDAGRVAESGTRLTDVRDDVTCGKCKRRLTREAT